MDTALGKRVIKYTPDTGAPALVGTQATIRLGRSTRNGKWQRFERDLNADLQAVEADNRVLTITDFYVRGTGRLDDIAVSTQSTLPKGAVYEDAEDRSTDRWRVIDNTPPGAAISNVADADQRSRVIALSGAGTANAYRLVGPHGENWGNTVDQRLGWSHQFSEYYALYVEVSTRLGSREIKYTPDSGAPDLNGSQVRIRLGEGTRNGAWQTFERDLNADLQRVEPDNALTSIDGFYVKGSGRLDNIRTEQATDTESH